MAKIICPNDALPSAEKPAAFRATRPHDGASPRTADPTRTADKSHAASPLMLGLAKAAVSIRALWARIRFKMLF